MISLFQGLVLAFIFGVITNGTPVEKRHTKYIAHEFHDTEVRLIGKRAENVDFEDKEWRFVAHLKIGSAKQDVQVLLDTASTVLNVPQTNSTCREGKICAAQNSFNPFESTSFKNLTIPAKSYFGPNQYTGFIVSDDFYFDDGKRIPQFEFQLLDSYPRDVFGIFGMGYSTNNNYTYVLATKSAGLINNAGFSLFKNSDKNGSFLLGGVDKAKYDGDLLIFNDSKEAMYPKSIITANGTVIPFTYKVLHDSGTPTMELLDTVVQKFYKDIGANDKGHIPCDKVLSGNKSLNFDFGPFTIPVYYKDIFNRSGSTCISNIHATKSPDRQYLGAVFLRNAYLAQNFDTKRIGLAPVKYTDESDIADFWF